MRETSDLEYKRELSRSYLKTVSALANYGTGRIVFGVDDDGTPLGLENPRDACLRIENAVDDADINAANIGVKLIQQFGEGQLYGVIMQGFNQVCSDSSRGASVDELVGNVAICGVRAAALKRRG